MMLHLLLAAVLLTGAQQDSDLQRADKLFAAKSYASAADAYEHALKGPLDPDRRPEIELRFAESLGRAKKWDRALQDGLAFVKRHRGTIWEPRGLHWLGRLYFGVPNDGWKAGGRFFRGQNAPTGSFPDKPQY